MDRQSVCATGAMHRDILSIDLFCGCGGFTQGLQDAGIKVLAGIDIWPVAIDTYKKNFDHLALCRDLATFAPADFSNEYTKQTGKSIQNLDMIIGGFPCQGFSIAGRRSPTDARNQLYIDYFKYVEYFKPNVFLIENVVGILSMKSENGTLVIDDIKRRATDLGYSLSIHKLYASDYEVPQKRPRVILCGHLSRTISPPPFEAQKYPSIPTSKVLQDRAAIPKSYYLTERALIGIQRKKDKSKAQKKGFGAQFIDINKPCYTITARYWKDGRDALVKYSDTCVRRLTETELAKIQTFPDTFVFCGSKRDVITQIGNAVACRFAYHLGRVILSHFYKMTENNQ